MADYLCYDCKFHRYGKDVSNSFRTAVGIHVCIVDPTTALIMDAAELKIIEHIGCPRKVKK